MDVSIQSRQEIMDSICKPIALSMLFIASILPQYALADEAYHYHSVVDKLAQELKLSTEQIDLLEEVFLDTTERQLAMDEERLEKINHILSASQKIKYEEILLGTSVNDQKLPSSDHSSKQILHNPKPKKSTAPSKSNQSVIQLQKQE
jgi:hypothetical protein